MTMQTHKMTWILFVATLFLACERPAAPTENPRENDTIVSMPAKEPQLALIKISPEIQKLVFVSPIVDSVVIDYSQTNLATLYYGGDLVFCNPTIPDSILSDFAQTQLKITGTNPYILLENGYAIIDWKWANFHPLSGAVRRTLYSSSEIYDNKVLLSAYTTNPDFFNGTLANEEYYLLPNNWQNVTDLREKWPLAEGTRIEKPEVRYVYIKDIENYGDYTESFKYYFFDFDLYYIYVKFLRDPSTSSTHVEKLDSVQSVYVKTLNQMINNNDFEKWTFNPCL